MPTLTEKILLNNSLAIYEMTGDSMAPFFKKGDQIMVTKVKAGQDLLVGDCLLCNSPSNIKPTCHRLIRIKDNLFFVKGDGAAKMDGPVAFTDVLGKVVAVKRQDKLIFLNTFFQKTKARVIAYLSLLCGEFEFMFRLIRWLYFLPYRIKKRLPRSSVFYF